MSNSADILERLDQVLEARRQGDPDKSYVAKLYRDGLETILGKIGEEAAETVQAGRGGDAAQITHEVADLWFHTLVLLRHQGIASGAVLEELARRFGTSGLDEKAARGKR